ncbi:MAG: hypothetical protein V4659_07400 [Pseudomonadota bacterium]
MRSVFKSHFFLRFAGGFALGAAALVALQPAAVAAKLSAQHEPVAYRG